MIVVLYITVLEHELLTVLLHKKYNKIIFWSQGVWYLIQELCETWSNGHENLMQRIRCV